ncbi:MAG: Rha family transcriptional regulator [Selenomonadaceae bacterium]|nr:Rha family transcriptional regulator [Selenomonadaceae bacterium]
MNELVFLKSNQALTTSLKMADYFGKRHDNVLQAIERANATLLNFKDSKNAIIKTTYKDETGKSNPMYLLNRDGFMFVAMGFTGEKAAQLKWNYIQAFNAMEAALAERKSEQWQEIRSATKVGYKDLSAAVKELYEWAFSHGCKVSEKVFYMNFAKLMNKTLGINPNSRDTLAAWQLYEIEKLQFIARTIIAGLLAKGEDYHLPYRDCKSAFETYARLSYINQRLLPN